MIFAGLQTNSFIDFPNVLACVIFTAGCNMDCWYCHNRPYLTGGEQITEEEIFDFLEKRKGFLDGVVISGGEPTLHNDLVSFAQRVKDMGYLIKLDTNGSNPQALRQVLGLCDYVAMDVKTSFENYSSLAGDKVRVEDVKESIRILQKSGVKHEFRTTMAPDVSIQDVEKIAKFIAPSPYFLQQFVVHDFLKKDLQPHSREVIRLAADVCGEYTSVGVRGVD